MAPRARGSPKGSKEARSPRSPKASKASFFIDALQNDVHCDPSLSASKTSIQNVLLQHRSERLGCLSFPFTAAFFTCFTLSVTYHEDVRTHFLVESSMKRFIEEYSFDSSQSRNLYDVVEHKDVWGWFHQVMLPVFFQQTDHLNRPLILEEWSTLLGHNKITGGVLVEQYRYQGSPPPSCHGRYVGRLNNNSKATQDLSGLYFTGEGFTSLPLTPAARKEEQRRLRAGAGGKAAGDGGEFQGPVAMADGALHLPYTVDANPEDTYPFLLFEQEPFSILQARVRGLEKSCWIDGGTEQISVKMNILNKGLDLLQYVTIIFVFPSTGGIFPAVKTYSSSLHSYQHWSGYLWDIAFLLLLVHMFSGEVQQLRVCWQEKALRSYWKDVWNQLDWSSILFGSVIVGIFIFNRMEIARLKGLLENVDRLKRPDTDYWSNMYEIHLQAEAVGKRNIWFSTLSSMFTLILMLRFFKAFKDQKRLAVVTNTIYSASSDIVHFGIVLISVFICFAYSGTVIFGQRLHEFSTFELSIASCFGMVCGEIDFSELFEEHQITVGIWLMGFIVLLYLVMMNMVLAIIMDVYTEVRSQTAHAPPIWEKAAFLIQYWVDRVSQTVVKRKDAVHERMIKDDDILQALSEVEEDIVTQRCLKMVIPSISYKQSKQILEEALQWEEHMQTQDLSLGSAMRLLHDTSLKINYLHKRMQANAKKKPALQKAIRKGKRLLLAGMFTGELHRLCGEMSNPQFQAELQAKEKAYKERKRRELIQRVSEGCMDPKENAGHVDSREIAGKGSHIESIAAYESETALTKHGVKEYDIRKSQTEIQALWAELKRTQREQKRSFEPLLQAVAQQLVELHVIPPFAVAPDPSEQIVQNSPRRQSRNARNMHVPQSFLQNRQYSVREPMDIP